MKRIVLSVALALIVSACGLNEHGPWLDWNGNQMRGSDMIEYEGFAICDQTQVLFIQFFGDKDIVRAGRFDQKFTSGDYFLFFHRL